MITSKFANEAGQEFRIHHNGDFSGEVDIVVPAAWVAPVPTPGGDSSCAVSVPFNALRALVFDYLRGKMVNRLETEDEDAFEASLAYLPLGQTEIQVDSRVEYKLDLDALR